MTDREPVLLVILIESERLRWLVGAIDFERTAHPLLASADNDIESYRQMDFDEQVLFLRHRLCGALQRGCDRLWAIQKKATHFVFVVSDDLPDAPAELTNRVAAHLAQWMSNPPVMFYSCDGLGLAPANLNALAGEISIPVQEALEGGLAHLVAFANDADCWERVPAKKTRQE